MAIKAIIFDCFGVLVASAEVTLYKAFPQYSKELLILDEQANIGLLSKEQFIDAVSKTIGVSPAELIKHHYCNVEDRDRNDSALDWAHKIKLSGKYKLGLLSNVGRDWLNIFLRDMDKIGLFDESILSFEVSITKPNPKIFEMMAEKLGVKPDECVMIDDRPENIAGAKTTGMQGIIFVSTRQAKSELAKILEA